LQYRSCRFASRPSARRRKALLGGTAHWGPDTGARLGVVGIGQLAYIKLVHAIATLRAGYRRSERQAHVMRALPHSDDLTRADAALYEAKARGRNRVEVAAADSGKRTSTPKDLVSA
jgi:hypothetical protein